MCRTSSHHLSNHNAPDRGSDEVLAIKITFKCTEIYKATSEPALCSSGVVHVNDLQEALFPLTVHLKRLQLFLLVVQGVCGHTAKDCPDVVLSGYVLEGGGGGGQPSGWVQLHAGGDDHGCRGKRDAGQD